MAKCKLNIPKFNLKQTCEGSMKTLCRKWEGETPKLFLIVKQLGKGQNEYYIDNQNLISFCRCTSLHVLMYPVSVLEWNMWSYWKRETILHYFHDTHREKAP